jgi:hypothetical protein
VTLSTSRGTRWRRRRSRIRRPGGTPACRGPLAAGPAGRPPGSQAARLPYWARASSIQEEFNRLLEKFVPVKGNYKGEEDSDYNPPHQTH